MADLNNTIVRGELRVTEDVNANGNITGNGITLSSVKNAGILGTDSSGKIYNNSSAYQPKGDYVTYDNASKDIYLGSYGIYSGTRPSSGSATLMGNGYWIKPSFVGVSSTLIGGTTPSVSSEMTPDYVSISNGKIKLNTSGIVSDAGTFKFDGNPGSVATSADLRNYQKKGNYVTTDTAQTITGRKTFNSPANVNGKEVATAIFKTSNGGQLIIGKEGPNSGTMLRFDQTAGTTRLQFRASATPGAMVWTQPEKGATLYFDLTNSSGASTRTTLDARSGTIARTSDIGNGKITIQKNGTEVGSFTTNQSGSKTINLALGIDDITDLRSQLNGKQPSGAYAERQSAQTITGNWTFTGTTNFNGTTKVNGNERASKGYVDGIFDSKLDASEATNFAKFTKFDSDTLKMTGGRLYRTSADDTVDRSSMYGYSSQNTHGTTYTRFAGMATIGSSQAFIGYYQYTKADGSGGDYIGNVTLSNGRLARINGSLSSVNELTDAYAVLSDLNNKANKTHTHAISDVNNLQTSLDEKASKSEVDSMNSQIDLLKQHNKVYYIYTWKTDSDFYGQGSAINEQFETNNAVFSVEMRVHIDTTPAKNACLNAQYVGVLTANDLKEGDIIVVAGYPPRYISDAIVHSTNGITRSITYQFSILNKQFLDRINGKANKTHTHAISDITNLQSILNGKVNSDDLLKITGSSGFNDNNWHYRKIGHFIFNSSDTRNGAPVHLSGVIGDWAQGKMIFDIFVSTRGGLKVNGFVRGTNPFCRLVIDNTENPNIFLAVQGFATYNIIVDTFENAKNENNAVRGSFHIDWTGGDDFTGSDVGVTATNFAYKDLLSRVASQRAYYSYTGTFAETNGTLTQLCSVQGGETGKIICVHAKATSSDSELSIQRKTSHYYDYDCIAVAPTGYTSGTYISCTGVVPPRLRYGIDTDYSKESTYYIFGKRVSEVYVITFDLP